jgi:DNA-binding transcriptional regulator/RsmH inhibitor MraZ
LVTQLQPGDLKRPPVGALKASVDSGRINTPVELSEYLRSAGINELFCTTLDERVIDIYTIPAWYEMLERLTREHGGEIAMTVATLGETNGGTVVRTPENASWRILLPANLRKKVAIGKDLHIVYCGDHWQAMSKEIHEERYSEAKEKRDQALAALRSMGLYR